MQILVRLPRFTIQRPVRLRASESGSIGVFIALSGVLLCGFAALAVDAGLLYFNKTELQNTADAVALAALADVGDATRVAATAVLYAQKNLAQQEGASVEDEDDDAETAEPLTADVVAVQGQWDGTTRVFTATDTAPNAVRVVASRTEATGNARELYFARVLGHDRMDVSASAVAYRKTAHCLMALEPTRKEALFLNSASDLDATDCSVYVASRGESPALRTNTAASITVEADQQICADSYSGGGLSQTPAANCPPPAPVDPWAGTEMPSVGACGGSNTDLTIESNTTLSPGTYCKKLEINNSTTVTLNPGVYVLRGALLKVNSGATLRAAPGGDGVFFYLVRDASFGDSTIDVNADSTVKLWPPASGAYEGLLFYSHTDNAVDKDQIINSHSGGYLKGSVYFPRSRVVLNSFGHVNASCGSWAANSYLFNSDSTFAIEAGTRQSCGFAIPFESAKNGALVK